MLTQRIGIHEARQLARALRGNGRSAEAVALLERAAEDHPEAWPLWHDLGLALMADGRPSDAVAAYQRTLALGGDRVAAVWVNLGNALRSSARRVEAAAAYRSGLERDPELAAAHYNLHAAVFDERAPEPALDALRRALALRPEHAETRFYLGALLRLGGADDAGLVDGLPEECAFLRASLDFVLRHRATTTRLFSDTFETLRFALGVAAVDGVVVELGVRRGTSLRFLATVVDEVHGFDGFEGLPEVWGGQAAGLYTAEGALPSVPENAELHVGLFADTLPRFVGQQTAPLRLANVDCDIYTSAREGLEALAPMVVDGTVLVFDEYLCNPGWEQEEHRALVEVAERQGWRFDYLAFSLFTKQAVVRVG